MTAALNPMPSADLAKVSLDRLDAVASAMERKWGIDRLPKLVDAPLAVRFRRQAERLDEAIRSNAQAAMSVQAEAMLRAWNALDAAAITGGWKPLEPTIWETVLPETGEVVAIVRDAAEASAIAKERKGAVWTLAEVAIAIEAFGETVRTAKAAFPGADVVGVRPAGTTAKLAIGSAAPSVRAEGPSSRGGINLSRQRRGRSAGVSGGIAGLTAPLPIPAPNSTRAERSPTAPPIDWDRGDDIPF
jgi:hypothetical protein